MCMCSCELAFCCVAVPWAVGGLGPSEKVVVLTTL